MQQQTFHGHSRWLKLQQESLWMSSSSKSSFSKRRHVQQNNFLGRGQTLLFTYWITTNLLFRTLTWRRMRTDRTKKLTYQRLAFSISWTRQELRGLVGSSVISDQAVPGLNSTAVSSVFLCHFFFQSEDSEKFLSLSHVRRWPPHVRATVRLL